MTNVILVVSSLVFLGLMLFCAWQSDHSFKEQLKKNCVDGTKLSRLEKKQLKELMKRAGMA